MLKNKTTISVERAFRDIIKEAGGASPSVNSDNGGEFKALCKEFVMIQITTDTYYDGIKQLRLLFTNIKPVPTKLHSEEARVY